MKRLKLIKENMIDKDDMQRRFNECIFIVHKGKKKLIGVIIRTITLNIFT